MGVDERQANDDVLNYLAWILSDLASTEVPAAQVPPSAGEFASPSLLWSGPDAMLPALSLDIPTHRFGISRLAWGKSRCSKSRHN